MTRRKEPEFPVVDGVEFRLIPGCPMYAVSSDGGVWSCKIQGHNMIGNKWKQLRVRKTHKGYLRVGLWVGKQVSKYVHCLVLAAFRGPCPDGMQACHGPDFSRTNNSVGNLRWDTKVANENDKKLSGTHIRGSAVSGSKLKESDVLEIRASVGSRSQASLARKFGVTIQSVNRIVHRKSWRHIA